MAKGSMSMSFSSWTLSMEEERGKRRSLNALIISLEFCLQNVKLNSDQSLTPYCPQNLATSVQESCWFDCGRYHWWRLLNNFPVAWYNPYHSSAHNKDMLVNNKHWFIWTFDTFSDAKNLYCGGFDWDKNNLSFKCTNCWSIPFLMANSFGSNPP